MNGEVQAIDWGAPIEAYHSDGRVLRAFVQWNRSPDSDGDHWLSLHGQDVSFCAGDDDDRIAPIQYGWRIRNVATPPQTPDVPPEVVTLTGEQANILRKVLAWVKAVPGPFAEEAASCLALMEPVDADEAYADDLLKQQGWHGAIDVGLPAVARMIAAAHRAGRSLAAGEG